MKQILILNGPPSSGKDTLADALCEAFGWQKVEFKAALRQDVCEVFNTNLGVLRIHETRKEIPTEAFLHPETKEPMSLRQALIYTSEQVIKPKFGAQVYGQRLLETLLASDADMFVCSDGGFESELIPLAQAGIKLRIMRIDRPGYTFAQDSRSYIRDEFVLALSEDGVDIAMMDFKNSDTYAKFIDEGMKAALGM